MNQEKDATAKQNTSNIKNANSKTQQEDINSGKTGKEGKVLSSLESKTQGSKDQNQATRSNNINERNTDEDGENVKK